MPEIMLTKGYESLPRRTGAMLVHSIITKAGIFALIPDSPRGARGPDRTFTDKEILELAITSFAAAQPDFTDVNEFHSDPKFYGVFLGSHGKLPAESTVRTRLDAIADKLKKHGYKVLMVANADMLKYYNIDPGALYNGFVPVDLDVSPLRNDRCKKEGVGLTYKQEVGYAPMFCYIGTHGLPIAAELREGTQHCQKGTPELLKEIIPVALSLTDKPLLFRFDSGNDAEENMRLLIGNPQIRFLIKRNFRRICKDDEALRLMNCATKVERPRDGKVVYTGTTAKTFAYTEEDGTKSSMTVRVVFQITERTFTWYGQQLIVPEREIDEWFTNLEMEEASDDEVIELYHDHGTSEQYHSEYKSDLDIEQLPSGKFNTNALILLLSTISYNCLRIIELLAREMPADSPIHFRDTKRRRLRTIIENLILIPSHFTTHARQMKLSLGKSNPWADVFIYVRNRISSIVASHRNAPPALAPVG